MPDTLQLRTGYYAKAKQYQEHGYLTIAISLIVPRWAAPFVDHSIAALAPSKSILDTLPDTETYTRRYSLEVLSRLNPQKIYAEEIAHIARLRGKTKAVLLCYEAPDKFCHRHLVADWFASNGVVGITEIAPEEISSRTSFMFEDSEIF